MNQYILLLLKFGVNIKRLLAEFLGTLLLVATVVGSGIMATNLSAGSKYQVGSFATPEFLGGLDLSNPALFYQLQIQV